MEVSSRRAKTSVASRGTSSYRAPEFLLEANPKYTNKVDMWALGCILYELVARTRAFRDDWNIILYAKSGKDYDSTLAGEAVPEQRRRDFVCKVIKELLNVDPLKRPRARELYERFISWGADGVLTHQEPTGASRWPIPELPTDVVVHDDNVQSRTFQSDL
jgi:serine/threonine protein kinase